MRFDGAPFFSASDDPRRHASHVREMILRIAELCPSLPQMVRGATRAEADARARSLLTTLGLSHRLEHRPSKLSGGEQQRVAVARALANQPALVLADEPTGNLDEATADEVLALARDLVTRSGCGFLMVTHSARLAATLDRHIHLSAGLIA